MKSLLLLPAIFFIGLSCVSKAQDTSTGKVYKNSIDVSPMSPFMKIYAIHYCHRIGEKGEGIIGPVYMNIAYKDIGHTDAKGFIAGYRRYLFKTFHVDYQLMPLWDHFYEENEQQRYSGFDLWNEFRFGYMHNFHIGKLPAFLNVQWPFGFALYSEPAGKPDSFKDYAKRNQFFYFPPMVFMGVRF